MISKNSITKLQVFFKDGLRKPIFLKITKYLFISVLIVHFGLIFMNQLTDNPLKHQFKKQLQRYTDPFFSQAWTLFAPNPINSNMSLLMRFQYISDKGMQMTEWMDVSEPLISDKRQNYWSPAQRVSKFTQSCMSNIHDNHRLILEHIAKTNTLKTDTLKAKIFYNQAMHSSYGFRSITQYAVYISNNFFLSRGINGRDIKLQYRILTAKFPRFSKRTADYYDLKLYEFTELTSDFTPIGNHRQLTAYKQ